MSSLRLESTAAPPLLVPDDYQHDVFFSYKRHDLTLGWTREVASRLKLWLTEELGKAEVFVDETCIDIGKKWPEELKRALTHSRCLVCVLSPPYFQSAWCVSEWKSFLKREKMIKGKPGCLIAPLIFHDGEHFPKEARQIEWLDVSEYAFSLRPFWESQKAVEFEGKLKVFAMSVAKIIRGAPPFRPDWPIIDGAGAPAAKIKLAKL